MLHTCKGCGETWDKATPPESCAESLVLVGPKWTRCNHCRKEIYA